MAYLAIVSGGTGRRAGFAATLGVALGLLILGLAAALGVAALIASSRILYEVLRWAGVLYLLFLAWEGWHGEEDQMLRSVTGGDSKFFVRGLLSNLLNPKAGVFYLTVLPTFVVEFRPLLSQTVTLSVVYVMVASTIHSAIVLLADTARPWLQTEGSAMVRRAFSLTIAALAIWLLFTTRFR